ncbi:hypothetical protein GCM10007880_05620 [Mesorhizobium amorphae]|nr:hypothetical protein GCM10007880_05620 [Mesorhizobium amorphae]
MQFLGRKMTIALGEKQIGQRDALACRPQAGFANPLVHSDIILPAALIHPIRRNSRFGPKNPPRMAKKRHRPKLDSS